MKSDVQEVLDRLTLAERVATGLAERAIIPGELPLESEERGWLAVAAERLTEATAALRTQLEQGLMLPELKTLRAEREQRLELGWVGSLRKLFDELVREVGQTSPLVESLFPHQRFDKLDRGGAALRAFRAEYETRRRSSYVQRLEADPEHPRLASLLASVDEAGAALSALEAANADGAAADALRARILEAGSRLERSVRQARALCEAALVDHPDRLLELGFNDRAKKRSARPPAQRDAEAS
jgi:hypothetical protein